MINPSVQNEEDQSEGDFSTSSEFVEQELEATEDIQKRMTYITEL